MSDFCCGARTKRASTTRASTSAATSPNPPLRTCATWSKATARPTAGTLKLQRGIEVGHVFFLGTRYSEALGATYLDENGKPQILQMAATGSA